MKIRIGFFIVATFFVFAVLSVACPYAEAHSEHASKSEHAKTDDSSQAVKAEPAGNETCPVSGEKIDPKASVTYEYKGKAYNFCCQDCVEQFKKDPEKYIKQMEDEKAGKVEPARPVPAIHH